MKKIILTLAAMAIAVSSFAQISVGAGYTNSAATTTVGSAEKNAAENGFFVEGNYSIGLTDNFAIVPGVRYTYLNAKDAANILGVVGISGETKEHYVAIPVYGQYALNLGEAKIYLFAGPTFNLGISSKTIASAVTEIISASKEIDNFEDMGLEKADVLIGGGVGIGFGRMAVKAGYDFGLLDRNSSEDATRKDATIHAGVYFSF